MFKAYPRHGVNLSAGCYSAALKTLFRLSVLRGSKVKAFEESFAEYIGVSHALAVSSGRAAIYLACKALGLKEGDEFLMPAYTFHIVPLVIKACGLKPVFIDVLPGSYNIDPALIEKNLTDRAGALMVTHMYGQPCEMESILKIADRHGLKIIEDCAHACGATYSGRKVGSFGDAGVFTFAMAKNMPCFGGGMITTKDAGIFKQLTGMIHTPASGMYKSLFKELLGTTINYLCTRRAVFPLFIFPLMRILNALGSRAYDSEPGRETVSSGEVKTRYLTRLTNLQGAVGLHQLTRIDKINDTVNRNAQVYNRELEGVEGIEIPQVPPGRTHTFLYYRVEASDRENLRQKLFRKGVDTAPDDMSDCTTLAPFKDYGVELPVASKLPSRILELPNNPSLKEKNILHISRSVKDALT
ncbi:DegT/DnrJ/EryC1/StrS family aminotransferase [Acidobacteriota bacterium]